MTTLVHTDARSEDLGNGHATDYERDRQRHVQAGTATLDAEAEKMDWPLKRLHALRDARLRALVRHAKEQSPWHARRLRGADPDRVSGDDLSMIPPMTKADLMENWDDIITDRRLTLELATSHLASVAAHGPAYLLHDYHVVASGGSSGQRGVFVWDNIGWLTAYLSTARHACGGPPPSSGERGAGATCRGGLANPRDGGDGCDVRRPARHTPCVLCHPAAGGDRRRTESRSSRLLACYPSLLHHLALEARAGRLHIAPRLLTCATEPLPAETRQVIEDVFGAPVIDAYGASENWCLAISSPGSPNLHLIEDVAVCEPVDRAGDRCRPARPAAPCWYQRDQSGLPLIRYELTDGSPSCGAQPGSLGRAAHRAGRGTARSRLYLRGRRHRASACLSLRPDALPESASIRCARHRAGLILPCGPRPTRRWTACGPDLIAALRELGLVDPLVTITAVEDLPRKAETGKLTRFIPLASCVSAGLRL